MYHILGLQCFLMLENSFGISVSNGELTSDTSLPFVRTLHGSCYLFLFFFFCKKLVLYQIMSLSYFLEVIVDYIIPPFSILTPRLPLYPFLFSFKFMASSTLLWYTCICKYIFVYLIFKFSLLVWVMLLLCLFPGLIIWYLITN